jgi:hypothetical protein
LRLAKADPPKNKAASPQANKTTFKKSQKALAWAAAFCLFSFISLVSLAGVANASEPGDPLYGTKLWLDRAGQVFAFSNQDKVTAILNYAGHRSEEIQWLIDHNQFDYIPSVVWDYQQALNTAIARGNNSLTTAQYDLLIAQQTRFQQLTGQLEQKPNLQATNVTQAHQELGKLVIQLEAVRNPAQTRPVPAANPTLIPGPTANTTGNPTTTAPLETASPAITGPAGTTTPAITGPAGTTTPAFTPALTSPSAAPVSTPAPPTPDPEENTGDQPTSAPTAEVPAQPGRRPTQTPHPTIQGGNKTTPPDQATQPANNSTDEKDSNGNPDGNSQPEGDDQTNPPTHPTNPTKTAAPAKTAEPTKTKEISPTAQPMPTTAQPTPTPDINGNGNGPDKAKDPAATNEPEPTKEPAATKEPTPTKKAR